MILITYWHDEDPDTITSIMCDSDSECQKIIDVLIKWNMSIISAHELNETITAAELDEMLTDAYNEN